MECFEYAVPANVVSYAPTFFISETKGEMLTELGVKNLFGKEFPRLFK